MQEEINKAIQAGALKEAIIKTRVYLTQKSAAPSLLMAVNILAGNLKNLEKKGMLGLFTADQIQVNENKITHRLLTLLNQEDFPQDKWYEDNEALQSEETKLLAEDNYLNGYNQLHYKKNYRLAEDYLNAARSTYKILLKTEATKENHLFLAETLYLLYTLNFFGKPAIETEILEAVATGKTLDQENIYRPQFEKVQFDVKYLKLCQIGLLAIGFILFLGLLFSLFNSFFELGFDNSTHEKPLIFVLFVGFLVWAKCKELKQVKPSNSKFILEIKESVSNRQ